MAKEGLFGRVAALGGESDCAKAVAAAPDDGFRHLQVRLKAKDASRVKCLADIRGLSVQDALVQAVNEMLAGWKAQPVENPGTAKRKKS